jgi:hypothetical protein
MASREQRVARNEALFREVNERIKDVTELLEGSDAAEFVCECGDESCIQPIRIELAEYEQVRRVSTRFVVVPNHVVPDLERVVTQTDRFAVVEKVAPQAVRIVEQEDPRSD